MRPDAARWLKPNWDSHLSAPRSVQPAEPAMTAAVIKAERDELLSLKALVAELKFHFALRAFGRKYRPDQARDDHGRWTDEGRGRNDPRVLSDITPDNVFEPGAQLAQNDRQTGYPVDLQEERQLGGHTIERHVGKSPEALLEDVRQAASYAGKGNDFAGGLRVGSFTSMEAANKLVNSTLAQNPDKVERVVRGQSPRESLDAAFGSTTGYEAYARTDRSQAYIRNTDGVRVVIVSDWRAAKGFRVDTAFPTKLDR